MVRNNNRVFVRQEENPQSSIMLRDTKKWRTDSGKNTLLQPESRGLPNPESEKQKGCNLYWIISETTVKRLKEIIPFYHMFIASFV